MTTKRRVEADLCCPGWPELRFEEDDGLGGLCAGRNGLDADAEFDVVVVVAGVGVEVVGSAALELVAATEFTAGDEAEAECAGAGGDPAEGDEEGVRLRLAGGKRLGEDGRDIFEPGAEDAERSNGPHEEDDSADGGREAKVWPQCGLGDVDLLKAEAEEDACDGGAGVFGGGVEDAVVECGLLKLGLGTGAGVGLEVLVGGDEEAGGAGVDAGVLIIERGREELGGWERDVNGMRGGVDADVFGAELGEIDAGDGLAVDDEEDAVSGEEVREDEAGFVAFDDGVERVDDGFETLQALDFPDDGGDTGVDGGGTAGDEGGETRGEACCGVAHEDDDGRGAEDDGQQHAEERAGGGTAGVVLGGHGLEPRQRAEQVARLDFGLGEVFGAGGAVAVAGGDELAEEGVGL